MPTQKVTCPTPRYVLHEDGQPIGPDIVQNSRDRDCLAIYGFSCKAAYDAFVGNSEGDLRPYPLMKGYLKNRIDEEHDEKYLVIVDAASPCADSVDASTMENVLAAQNKAVTQLVCDFRLTFCSTGNAYTLEDIKA